MKYIIGVDGGGTKTEAVAYSLNGEELGRGYSGFGNLLLGESEALCNIEKAIENCMESTHSKLYTAECIYLYLGLAGIESDTNKKKSEAFLEERFAIKNEVSNDAEIALAAVLKGEDGILTISGTGSISYGKYKEKKERAGGWGHLLGDEGSGYDIALQGFKRMILEEDKLLKKSGLTKSFMENLKIDKVEGIKKFIYSATKSEIAAFVPLVLKGAEEGESVSLSILKNAGRNLAEITEQVYKKLNFKETVKIGIKGSILTNVNIVREEFETVLKNTVRNISIVNEEGSPAKGAYYLALKKVEGI